MRSVLVFMERSVSMPCPARKPAVTARSIGDDGARFLESPGDEPQDDPDDEDALEQMDLGLPRSPLSIQPEVVHRHQHEHADPAERRAVFLHEQSPPVKLHRAESRTQPRELWKP